MNFIDLKLLYRDWRGGQLNLVMSALVLAVTVVTAVSLFADRVERGITQQITSFLAADLAVRSGLVIPAEFKIHAKSLGLATSEVAEFRSMVFAGDRNHLAAVKVVDEHYPLRGQIELTEPGLEQVSVGQNGPGKDEAWVDARLLSLLDLSLGDRLEVGYANLTISRVIVKEPDRGVAFGGAGARVMINSESLKASKLIRPGARVTYTLLIAGDDTKIKAYQQWFDQDKKARTEQVHLRLITPQDSEQRLGEAFERGRTFLLLSGTIGVLLAGLAIALASFRYALRLRDQIALMKVWGLSAVQVRRRQLIRLLVIAIIATSVGVFLGWLAHFLLLELAHGVFDVVLPAPSSEPWLIALVTGVLCVLGFALPALWHLPAVSPLQVLRRDLPLDLLSQTKRVWIGLAMLFLLSVWYSGNWITSLLFLGALLIILAVCAIVALQFLKVLNRFSTWRGSYVRLGLANLWRRRGQTVLQLVAFSTTIMLLLIVTGMRTNLIQEWEAQLPETTPSHFLFNVSSEELNSVKALLKNENIESTNWYPMVRGRVVSINHQPISAERLARSNGLSREVNFTESMQLPASNSIEAGHWWSTAPPEPEFSMEQKVAGELGVTVGDIVGFSVGGINFEAKLSSVRSVDWQSMNPNFFVIFYPGTLDKFSPSWITALRVTRLTSTAKEKEPIATSFVIKMVRQFPTTVVIELTDIIGRIRDMIKRVTQGLEMILFLILACGGLVLFASIGVSYDERLRESALLRTLGSSRKMVLGALAVEYASLGLISGLIASIGAELVLYLVQTRLLDMPSAWHPALWVFGILVGVGLVLVLGLLRSREIVTVPPLQSLRQLD